jgi:hypothetical protein
MAQLLLQKKRVLDCIPLRDHRSRDYPIRTLLPPSSEVERKKVEWDLLDTSFPLDQYKEGACPGFGWSGELSCAPVLFDTSNESALALYHRGREFDRAMGYYWTSGGSVLGVAKALLADGMIEKFRWAFGITDVIDTLITKGPLVLGINWHQSMYETTPAGLVRVDGPIAGRHSLVARGYWPDHPVFGEVIMWTNSWGRSYGLNGTGYIKVSDLGMLLKAGGEACIATDLPPAQPKPVPSTQVYVTQWGSTFHRPDVVHFGIRRNKWYSRTEALAAGYRPCRNCKP